MLNNTMRMSEILSEAIPLKMAKPYVAAGRHREYDAMFQSFASEYGRGKSNPQRLYFPLELRAQEKARSPYADNLLRLVNTLFDVFVQNSVEFLGNAKEMLESKIALSIFKRIDYLNNIDFSKDYSIYITGRMNIDGREERIGKLFADLQKFLQAFQRECHEMKARNERLTDCFRTPETALNLVAGVISDVREVYQSFINDPTRQMRMDCPFYVVMSRHPYDIATMSTGRGWTSCTNLIDGSEKKYVIEYVKGACLIAYLVREGDWDIKHPSARMLICRYNSIDEDESFMFWPQDIYGADCVSFIDKVESICRDLNKEVADGDYKPYQKQQYKRAIRKVGDWVYDD